VSISWPRVSLVTIAIRSESSTALSSPSTSFNCTSRFWAMARYASAPIAILRVTASCGSV
jgi:hypothetical protein